MPRPCLSRPKAGSGQSKGQARLQHQPVEGDDRKLVIAAAGEAALAPKLDQYAFAVDLIVEQLQAPVDVLAIGPGGEAQEIDALKGKDRRGANKHIHQIDRVDVEPGTHSGLLGSK